MIEVLNREETAMSLQNPIAHQVSLGGNRDENSVVADSDLLALGALLRRGVHCPPAGLA